MVRPTGYRCCDDCDGAGVVKSGEVKRKGLLGFLGIETAVRIPCPRCHGTGANCPPLADQQRSTEWATVFHAAYGPGFTSPPPTIFGENAQQYFERTGCLTRVAGETPVEWLTRYRRVMEGYERDDFGTLRKKQGTAPPPPNPIEYLT